MTPIKTIYKTYETDTHVYFWGSVLSNWAKYDFVLDGVKYSSSEQAMMAAKARVFNDPESLAKIMAIRDPKKQKELGRAVKGFDKAKWLEVCYPIVAEAVYQKFRQNNYLKEFLLNTGTKTIVEAAPNDEIWGVGLHATDPDILDEAKWKGTNWLGKCLMEARERIRQDDSKVWE